MTLDEIIVHRDKLEYQIGQLLLAFERECAVRVTSVEFGHVEVTSLQESRPRSVLGRVHCTCEIP